MAYFGAEAVKTEAPGKGDPLRSWRILDDKGTSFWWTSIAHNKKSLTIDLSQEEGRQNAHQLINKADVLIEYFRPGKMESWQLGPGESQGHDFNFAFLKRARAVSTLGSFCNPIHDLPRGNPCYEHQ